MSTVPTGMVAVRLADIPEKIRVRFGTRMYEDAVADGDVVEATRIHAAMYAPSAQTHWVPRAAYDRARKW